MRQTLVLTSSLRVRRGFIIRLKWYKSTALNFGGAQNFGSKDNFQYFCKQLYLYFCFGSSIFGDAKGFCPNLPKLAQKGLHLIFCKCWAPFLWSQTTLGTISAQIFRDFPWIFKDCVLIFRDFPWIFDKSKLLRLHLRPLPPTPLVQRTFFCYAASKRSQKHRPAQLRKLERQNYQHKFSPDHKQLFHFDVEIHCSMEEILERKLLIWGRAFATFSTIGKALAGHKRSFRGPHVVQACYKRMSAKGWSKWVYSLYDVVLTDHGYSILKNWFRCFVPHIMRNNNQNDS